MLEPSFSHRMEQVVACQSVLELYRGCFLPTYTLASFPAIPRCLLRMKGPSIHLSLLVTFPEQNIHGGRNGLKQSARTPLKIVTPLSFFNCASPNSCQQSLPKHNFTLTFTPTNCIPTELSSKYRYQHLIIVEPIRLEGSFPSYEDPPNNAEDLATDRRSEPTTENIESNTVLPEDLPVLHRSDSGLSLPEIQDFPSGNEQTNRQKYAIRRISGCRRCLANSIYSFQRENVSQSPDEDSFDEAPCIESSPDEKSSAEDYESPPLKRKRSEYIPKLEGKRLCLSESDDVHAMEIARFKDLDKSREEHSDHRYTVKEIKSHIRVLWAGEFEGELCVLFGELEHARLLRSEAAKQKHSIRQDLSRHAGWEARYHANRERGGSKSGRAITGTIGSSGLGGRHT